MPLRGGGILKSRIPTSSATAASATNGAWRTENPNPETPGGRSIPRNRIVSWILQSIFTGELSSGDRLVEEELAERLGVSRTPVREALRDLQCTRMIVLRPNHGATVRPFGPQQLLEIYQLRRILEVEATRLASRFISPSALKEIRDQMQALAASPDEKNEAWLEQSLSLDQRLHELIACSSGSERLSEEIHQYWMLARSIGDAVKHKARTQEPALHEHIRIIERLIDRDADTAALAMGQHLDKRAKGAIAALFPQ